jgi:3-dehydroquinate dehydratase-1
MICVSLADLSYEGFLKAIQSESFAEIRIDKSDLKNSQIEDLFKSHPQLIATCRSGKYNEKEREKKLKTAIASGASYVDLEVESPDEYLTDMLEHAHANHCKVIISYHNFDTTPTISELKKITDICFEQGADVCKIVTTIENNIQRARILSLYAEYENIVAFGMGERGKLTRLLAPLLGAPFTYASRGAGNEVAPGQIDKVSMLEKIEMLNQL